MHVVMFLLMGWVTHYLTNLLSVYLPFLRLKAVQVRAIS